MLVESNEVIIWKWERLLKKSVEIAKLSKEMVLSGSFVAQIQDINRDKDNEFDFLYSYGYSSAPFA